MKIGIVTGFASKDAAGLEQFLLNLLNGLARERRPGDTYLLYTSARSDIVAYLAARNLVNTFQVVPVGWGRWWKHIGLWFAPRADVYIWNGPIVSLTFFPRRSIVIAYDFAYRSPRSHSPFRYRVRTFLMNALTRIAFARSSRNVAISQATVDEAVRLFGADGRKWSVIYPGVRAIGTIPEKPIPTPKAGYFFFVGTVKPRKNVLALVEGFIEAVQEGLEEHLIIAGHLDQAPSYVTRMREVITEAGMTERVHLIGPISDEVLVYLYRHARAFAFLSTIEGFGMPILEAMSVDTPVLIANASSLPEVAGDAALRVEPGDIPGIAHALIRLSREPELRATLIEKGRKQYPRFTWEGAADALIEEAHRMG